MINRFQTLVSISTCAATTGCAWNTDVLIHATGEALAW
jgi:hypothetical protein